LKQRIKTKKNRKTKRKTDKCKDRQTERQNNRTTQITKICLNEDSRVIESGTLINTEKLPMEKHIQFHEVQVKYSKSCLMGSLYY
jgi:hypothetical protein